MALKCFDGFDNYNQQSDINARSGSFFQYGIGTAFSQITRPGRLSYGGCLQVSGVFSADWGMSLGSRNAFGVMGMALVVVDELAIRFNDSVANGTQFTIRLQPSNGTVSIRQGGDNGTQIFLSSNNQFLQGTTTPTGWFYLEVKTTIAASGAGSIVVRINNVVVANLTGITTQQTANAWFDQLDFACPNAGFTWFFLDDMYYCDSAVGSGSFACNDFLNDVRVASLKPVGTDQAQWSPNPNTNQNWQNVAEQAMDSDSTYNSSTTIGQEDRFNFESMPGVVSAIFGAQISIAARKDDASLRKIKSALKSGATEVFGTVNTLPDTNYSYFVDPPVVLDPNTGLSWTNAALNAVKAGYQMVA